MATMITSECINCGACEPECPNTAIYQGGVEWQDAQGNMHPPLSNDIFYIVPEKCTECVGFHDHEACAAVCPVDCCVPNPEIPETHEVLMQRARALHPDEAIPDDAPSRFKKDGAAPVAPANGHDAAAAPAAAPAPKPAAPAAAPRVAAPAPRGRVEKPIAKPAPPRPARTFPGELPIDFDDLLTQLGSPRRRLTSRLAILPLLAIAASQGILGALPAKTKRRLEAAVADHRFFSGELATGANLMLNAILYPIVCVALAVVFRGVDLFSQRVNGWMLLGFAIATGEALVRVRESVRGLPLGTGPLRGAVYAPVVWPLGWLIVKLVGARGAESSVGFDGFSAGRERYDDKLERERRYGDVYRIEDRDDAFILRLEFPRVVPPTSLGTELGLPSEMPDYDFELSLDDGEFVVHGKVVDPQVRKLTAVAPAFPSEFTTNVRLGQPVTGFRHRYRDRTLEVILPKAAAR
jgi:ferredoxin